MSVAVGRNSTTHNPPPTACHHRLRCPRSPHTWQICGIKKSHFSMPPPHEHLCSLSLQQPRLVCLCACEVRPRPRGKERKLTTFRKISACACSVRTEVRKTQEAGGFLFLSLSSLVLPVVHSIRPLQAKRKSVQQNKKKKKKHTIFFLLKFKGLISYKSVRCVEK